MFIEKEIIFVTFVFIKKKILSRCSNKASFKDILQKHCIGQEKEASALFGTFLGNGLSFPSDRLRCIAVLCIQSTNLVAA